MPKKHKENENFDNLENVEIAGAGITVDERIVTALKDNYMPYAVSVVVSRSLPEIDGFKPSHRKLLYTMYLMGLLGSSRTKSANVVGQTMKLNPHGDAAIYDTMVRMTRGNETLLHPYVDSKGNFGKTYSSSAACAAPRYTEVKLAPICEELFSEINKDAVPFVPNYDNEMMEPTLLPATFPTILVNHNMGIAVAVASKICSFNLAEVCETTVKLLKDPNHDIASTLKGPDFATGGLYLYDKDELQRIYDTGSGSMRLRAQYEYDPKNHCIEITQIPASTTIEEIITHISDNVKKGTLREINSVRDLTDLGGLRISIEIKRGTDPDRLMQKLFKLTELEDSFDCNFTVLVGGVAKQLGIREIIFEWVRFRRECIRRRTAHDLEIKQKRLHLLDGLQKIILDIDKAVKIVRETQQERDVVPNLMIGFGIDETQANYIAEIKLRYLNREYILNRLSEKEQLLAQAQELSELLESEKLIDKVIIREQAEVATKYVQPRRTKIIYDVPEAEEAEPEIEDYPVSLFFTRDGYFKKITPQSLRMSSDQKLKELDSIVFECESRNSANLVFFTNKCMAYKARVADFDDCKASVLGDYTPAKLEMDEGEVPVSLAVTDDFSGFVVAFYANGKTSKVPLELYKTKLNRKKLQNAYSDKSELVCIKAIPADEEFALFTTNDRLLLVNTAFIPLKQTRDTIGVNVITLKKGAQLKRVEFLRDIELSDQHRFRTRNLPAAGALLRDTDIAEQTALL